MKSILIVFLTFFITITNFGQTGVYVGSGSVSQGIGVTTTANLMPNCTSNHTTPIGNITALDNTIWTVPASNYFEVGPYASDLYNSCNNSTPLNLAAADLSNILLMMSGSFSSHILIMSFILW